MKSALPAHWARAFRKTLDETRIGEEQLARNVGNLINKKGIRRQSATIAQCIAEEIVHHSGGRWVVAESARPFSREQKHAVGNLFSDRDYIEERIRPDLIAGVRLVVDGIREFDGSLKRKLDGLL